MNDQPRKRDAAKTAERIVACAQKIFHQKGYDAASTREIADCAGVNMALITRYFGSKKGLFEKAVLPHLSIDAALGSGDAPLPERLAAYFAMTAPKDAFDPMVVLVRSATSEEVGPLLAGAIRDWVIKPLSATLQGDDAEARATLLATQGAGLILWLRILDGLPLDDTARMQMRSYLSDYFRGLIDKGGESD